MRTKHRAMALIEMVTVIAVFAILLVPVAGITRSLVKGIPNSYNIYQTNESALNAITTLKHDITKAEDITLTDNPAKLQLTNSYETIVYTFSQNILTKQQNGKTQQWQLPRVKFDFKIHDLDTGTSAVEIRNYISVKKAGKDFKKLCNSYFFYAGLTKKLKEI